jgi:transketolase
VPHTDVPFKEGLGRGAYIVVKEKGRPDFTLFATGSEVNLAIDVADALQKRGKDVRVVSMPCWELFDQQPKEYRDSVVGGNLGQRVSIEAGVSFGWSRFIGDQGISIAVDDFGASAPDKVLAKAYGFTVDQVLEKLICCN